MEIPFAARGDEWNVVESLLPSGWEEQARILGAFQRARYVGCPGDVLRLILFHVMNDCGLRATVAQARAAGLMSVSQVALLKRLRTAGPWLRWLAMELCRGLRERPELPGKLRPRAVDSTTIQGPAAKGTDWRLHYTLDLLTMGCDWHELTDAHGAEGLERTPVRHGDVLIGDRNYFRAKGVRVVVGNGADVLVRMRWTHPKLVDDRGNEVSALSLARDLRVNTIGEWPVAIPGDGDSDIGARIITVRLPDEVAKLAVKRMLKNAARRQKSPDPRSTEAASFVMLFTTLPQDVLEASKVTDLYRYRWQVEIAFKRHKQLLKLGKLPHKDPWAAESWILAKLVVALLLETLCRRSAAVSPWGYEFDKLQMGKN